MEAESRWGRNSGGAVRRIASSAVREPATDVLDRVREAGGRLLRAERAPLGPGESGASATLRLTFDVGRVLLRVTAEGPAGLDAEVDDPGESEGPGAAPSYLNADEDEPWWRLLGQPLLRVEARGPEESPEALLLQFRREDERPRRVEIVAERGAVAVRTAR